MSSERSAKEVGEISRAAAAGEKDGQSGTHDPDSKLENDTDDQKAAYEDSYDHGRSDPN